MPLFQLDDLSTPNGRWWTVHRLLAVMLFPDEPAEQDRCMAAIAGFGLNHPALPATSALNAADESTRRLIPVSRSSMVAVLSNTAALRQLTPVALIPTET
jgi:hypothetical protein